MSAPLIRAVQSILRRLFPATQARLFAEPLEQRRMLFDVNGTSGADIIRVAVVDGFIYSFVNIPLPPLPVSGTININAGDGNDLIVIFNSEDEPIDVYPGNGSDDILVCPGGTFGPQTFTRDLDQLSARVYVRTGTDGVDDDLDIYDQDDAGNDTYNIFESASDPMRMQKPEPGFESEEVWWGEANMRVRLHCNNGSNSVNVQSSVNLGGTDESLEINLGAGQDTVTFQAVMSNGNRFEVSGLDDDDVTLLIGDIFAGSATIDIFSAGLVSIDDPAATETYRFTEQTLPFRTELALIDGTQTGRINFYRSGTTVGLTSSNATQASTYDLAFIGNLNVNISAGAGNDTFSVSSGDFDPGSAVTLSGGGGTDSLTLDDREDTVNYAYSFEDGQFIKRTQPRTNDRFKAAFSSIESATIQLNDGPNTFTSDGTYGGLPGIFLNGNSGGDLFTLRPSTVTTLILNGDGPTSNPGDAVIMRKGDATNGGVLLPSGVGSGSYFYSGFQQINFSGMEAFSMPPTVAAPDLSFSDDTGTLGDDNITNRTALTFFGGGTAAGDKVELRRDGNPNGSATATGPNWTVVGTFPQGDASYNVQVLIEDGLSGLRSSPSPILVVRVDTIAPTNAPTAALDLQASSDSGLSSTDNVTNVVTPTFSGAGADPGVRVQLVAGGVVTSTFANANASGSYALTALTQADGTRTYGAAHVDVAGNVGPQSPMLSVTIDTVAPAAPAAAPDLQATSDSGQSSTDNITNDSTPTFTVNSPELVRLLRDSQIVANYAVGPNVTASTISNGTHSFTARSVDVAGNTSAATAALSITVDTTAPAVPSAPPNLEASSDSGQSSTDNITNDTTPTFAVTGPELIQLRSGTTIVANYAAPGLVTTSVLSSTTQNITALSIDVAGNTSAATAALSITVDTTAPAVPAAPDLQPASDSGQLNTDNITNDTTPTFTINAPELVNLLVNGVTTLSYASPPFVIASLSGNPATAYNISARSVDVAGNLSVASPTLAILIDTVAPSGPSAAPDLLASSDTGVSSSDNITSDNTPTVIVAGPELLRLRVDGVTVADYLVPGNFTYPVLADGPRQLGAFSIDAAGNLSAVGLSFSVTIDTAAPTLVGAPAFEFEQLQGGVPHAVRYNFSENVEPTLAAGDLTTSNVTTATPITPAVAYDGVANSAVVTFPTQNAGSIPGNLPDGNYRTQYATGAITDIAGNALAGGAFDWFVLSGDANRDRSVNIGDFSVVAARFNQPGTFSQGDFDYSGTTDIGDFSLLASRFNTTLPAPGSLPRAAEENAPLPTPASVSRVIDLLAEAE